MNASKEERSLRLRKFAVIRYWEKDILVSLVSSNFVSMMSMGCSRSFLDDV